MIHDKFMIYLLSGPAFAALAVIAWLIPVTRPKVWKNRVLYTGIALFVPVLIGVCSDILPLVMLSIVCKPIIGLVAFAVSLGGGFTSIQHQYPRSTMTACIFLMVAGIVDVASAYQIAKNSF